MRKSLLAVPPLHYRGSTQLRGFRELGTQLMNTILNDLNVSSYFQFISQNAFLEDTSRLALTPAPATPNGFHFEKWRQIKADFLVRGAYTLTASQLSVELYVYHVPSAQLRLHKIYQGKPQDVRLVAHTFANDFIKNLTDRDGIFRSQVVVASDRAGRGWREIYVMDWDGHNVQQVTRHRSVALSPAWSPGGRMVTYTAYLLHRRTRRRNADLLAYDLRTKRRRLLSARKGINSGSTFDPLGQFLYLTISQGGSPDIFRMTMDGKNLARLTKGPHGAMNVEPAISPDGKRIAFSSDRSGKPMVYIMNADGTNLKRITFAGRYNATPDWSPNGKQLVFAGWDRGHNDIFIVNDDGTNLRRLTTTIKASGKYANNEAPTFSPDGRHIMYVSDKTSKKQLYIIDTNGQNEHRITVDRHNYYKPKWGRHKPM